MSINDPRLARVTWKSANAIYEDRMAEETAAFEKSKKFYEQFDDVTPGKQLSAEHRRKISEGRRRQLAEKN